MSEVSSIQSILAEMAQHIADKGNDRAVGRAFDAYKQCLEPLVRPYVRTGFLEEDESLPRFLSETATLHLAVSLTMQWCSVHGVCTANNFWDIHPEARFFSWYELPELLLAKIKNWTIFHSDVEDILQAIILATEISLKGLKRRSLGEFFTPTDIADHLVDLVGYNPVASPETKVADPACGNGNLLASVAARTVQAVQSGLLDSDIAIECLNGNIFGFDIQPIAVLLTRLQLLLTSMPVLRNNQLLGTNVFETLSFPGIRLRDPLFVPEDFWNLFASFDMVVSNPPFLKVAKSSLQFAEKYKEVLSGHINLYQLFLWWAIRATRSEGRLVFLLPQSIRSGQYSSKLRKEIAKACDVTAITGFVDRTGVFDSVEQPMMIVALKKPAAKVCKPAISVRISANGQSLNNSAELSVNQEQVVWVQDSVPVWRVSNERLDYDIMTKVCGEKVNLRQTKGLKILNGGFVWNQHKERLRSTEGEATLPLISSVSIGAYDLTFPPQDKRVSDRLFVDMSSPSPGPIYKSAAVLIKRTTPKIVRGRRIVAAILFDDFLERYPCYLAENHVNVILANSDNLSSHHLLGLCAWLNSRLANFAFGMMNVSSHLSKFDLSHVPLPISLLLELGNSALCAVDSSNEELKQRQTLDQIDEQLFNVFGLSYEESQRVLQVVPPAI